MREKGSVEGEIVEGFWVCVGMAATANWEFGVNFHPQSVIGSLLFIYGLHSFNCFLSFYFLGR